MELPIADRAAAGQALGEALTAYADRQDVIVLALPRGGVPVAYQAARRIHAPLDLMLIRKLGAPGREELAMGAIAAGGLRVLNEDIVSALRIDRGTIDAVAQREQQELERRLRAYRGDRPLPDLHGRTLILVDDGIATGATMRAAIAALRQQQPSRVVVAVPVAPPDAVERMRTEADEVVCLETPEPFLGVGRWYRDFPQLRDADVQKIMADVWGER
jgi:putative phosphoribosyl transferase